MYKVAVIGDYDSIYGFSAIGFEIFIAEDIQQAKQKLKTLLNSSFSVVFLTENLAVLLEEEIDKYRNIAHFTIIPIPGINTNLKLGAKRIAKLVEKATGGAI